LIVLGAAGAVDMNEALQHQNIRSKVIFRTVAATVLSGAMHDHAAAERVIRETDLDYTILHAPRLRDEPQTGNYRVEADGLPPGATTISRADVAEFMLDQLESTKYVRKGPYIGV
jgi:putative NADH-flavin reductase